MLESLLGFGGLAKILGSSCMEHPKPQRLNHTAEIVRATFQIRSNARSLSSNRLPYGHDRPSLQADVGHAEMIRAWCDGIRGVSTCLQI